MVAGQAAAGSWQLMCMCMACAEPAPPPLVALGKAARVAARMASERRVHSRSEVDPERSGTSEVDPLHRVGHGCSAFRRPTVVARRSLQLRSLRVRVMPSYHKQRCAYARSNCYYPMLLLSGARARAHAPPTHAADCGAVHAAACPAPCNAYAYCFLRNLAMVSSWMFEVPS
jgi:hypothetical protein